MKFILRPNQYILLENVKYDTEDLNNIFSIVTDLDSDNKYTYDLEFIGDLDKPRTDNIEREDLNVLIRQLANEFCYGDHPRGNRKLQILKKIGNFIKISLTREIPLKRLLVKNPDWDSHPWASGELKLKSPWIETEFYKSHTELMRETLEEIEDRIKGLGLDFINNIYSTEYVGDDILMVVIHYFLFEPRDIFITDGSKRPIERLETNDFKDEFNFKGSWE